jgi:hypothetical protein
LYDDSLQLQAEGFWNDTGVSSHTIRSVDAHQQALLHPQLMYRMARLWHTVAFLPLALRRRIQRNAIWLKTCIRTLSFLFVGRKTEIRVLPAGSVASISAIEIGGFTSRFGKYEGT